MTRLDHEKPEACQAEIGLVLRTLATLTRMAPLAGKSGSHMEKTS